MLLKDALLLITPLPLWADVALMGVDNLSEYLSISHNEERFMANGKYYVVSALYQNSSTGECLVWKGISCDADYSYLVRTTIGHTYIDRIVWDDELQITSVFVGP